MSLIPNENTFSLNVVGLGNAIVDILTFVDDSFLADNDITKASMNLCSHVVQEQLISKIGDFTCEAGGSVANTINSLAALQLQAGFMGVVAQDHWGLIFEESFNKSGAVSLVETNNQAGLSTATSLILITPDSERSMNTHLGVAGKISNSTFHNEVLERTPILFIEGYAFDEDQTKKAVFNAIDISHGGKNMVALTLSDQECVSRHHSDFLDLVSSVDILLANEKEILRLWDVKEKFATKEVIENNIDSTAPITVVTKSERGCTLIANGEIIEIPAKIPTELLDLTGAGDQFAAGFLYGIVKNWDHAKSVQFGIELATEVISQIGPRIAPSKLTKTLEQFEN